MPIGMNWVGGYQYAQQLDSYVADSKITLHVREVCNCKNMHSLNTSNKYSKHDITQLLTPTYPTPST